MKKLIILSICFSIPFILLSQEDFRVVKSKITLAGTSTLHDWTADAGKVNGTASFTINNGVLKSINSLTVTIDASSIKSNKGSSMDKNIYKELKTKTYPNITFSLTKVSSLMHRGSTYDIKAEGKLTIAGTTNTIDLTVTGKQSPGGGLVFYGSKTIKMTDFKIEPPTMFLGTLKTADEVTITFETTLSSTGLSQK